MLACLAMADAFRTAKAHAELAHEVQTHGAHAPNFLLPDGMNIATRSTTGWRANCRNLNGISSLYTALVSARGHHRHGRPCLLAAPSDDSAAEEEAPLRMERNYDSVTPRTLRAVRTVSDFEAALFQTEGWVVLRHIWDPEDEDVEIQPARLRTLANFEEDRPRDHAQYELAAGLAARILRAPALADPANGGGIDNAFDHFEFAYCLDVPVGKYALVIMPTDLTLVGLQGYASRLTSIEDGPRARAREFELNPGDALVLDDTCSRGCPLGIGGDQLVYRFVACSPGAKGVLWRTPPDMLVDMMAS